MIAIFGKCYSLLEKLQISRFSRWEARLFPIGYPLDHIGDHLEMRIAFFVSEGNGCAELTYLKRLQSRLRSIPVVLIVLETQTAYADLAHCNSTCDCLREPFSEKQLDQLYLKYFEEGKESKHRLLPPAQDAAGISVRFMGEFQVLQNGRSVLEAVRGSLKHSLLAYLLYFCKSKIPRHRLTEQFWPDKEAEYANNSLSVTIHSIRQRLKQCLGSEVIYFGDGYFYIEPALSVHRDIDDFLEAFSQGRVHERRGEEEQATRCYEQVSQMDFRFLEGFCGERNAWTLSAKEEFTEKYLYALEFLSVYWHKHQRYDKAIEILKTLLYIDDCRESAYSRMMSCYIEQGRREEAVRLFFRCEQTLRDKLRLRPSPQVERLYKKVVES